MDYVLTYLSDSIPARPVISIEHGHAENVTPSALLPHDVAAGVAREDAVGAHSHLSPRGRGGGDVHAARAAHGVVAEHARVENGVATADDDHAAVGVAPQLAALQQAARAHALHQQPALLAVVDPARGARETRKGKDNAAYTCEGWDKHSAVYWRAT